MAYIAPSGTLLASAAFTTTQSSAAQNSGGAYRGVKVVFDVTAVTSGASLVLTIESYDPASAKWVAILTGAAVTGAGVTTNQYNIHPVMTAAANVTVNLQLPVTWRVTVTPADTKSMTYSLGYIYLP